jgi:hypothetical protein
MNGSWGAVQELQCQSLFEYQLIVHCTEGSFDGKVFVRVDGNYQTDWLLVKDEGGAAYSPSQPASITLKLSDLGEPGCEWGGGSGEEGPYGAKLFCVWCPSKILSFLWPSFSLRCLGQG